MHSEMAAVEVRDAERSKGRGSDPGQELLPVGCCRRGRIEDPELAEPPFGRKAVREGRHGVEEAARPSLELEYAGVRRVEEEDDRAFAGSRDDVDE